MAKRQKRGACCAVLLMLLMPAPYVGVGPAAAQMELAVMQGTVTDDAGKPLEEVTFRIKDTERGREVVVKSDRNGRFYRRGLQAVEYEISVEKDGYQPIKDKVRLTAGMDRRFDFKLARAAAAGSAEFAEGVKAYNAGNFAEAARLFEQAVQRAPTVPELHVNLALAYFRLNRLPDAVAGLEKAAALAPADPRVLFQLGSAYVDMKDLPKAAAALELGLSKVADPKDPLLYEARTTLGSVYFAQGAADKAQQQYEQALAVQPAGAVALLGLGKIHFGKGNVNGALAAFERVVAAHPGSPQAAEASTFIGELKK